MRFPTFSKTALLAAGAFAASALCSYAEKYDSSKYLFFGNYGDGEIVVDTSEGQMTISSNPSGAGDLIKTGSGTLELSSSYSIYYSRFYASLTNYNPYVHTTSAGATGSSGTSVPTSAWTSGSLIVEKGILRITGVLNWWEDYGSKVNSLITDMPIDGRMAGVDSILLGSSTRLEVGANTNSGIIAGSNNRFVFLNNLSGSGAILDVGWNNVSSSSTINDVYHVDLHVDADMEDGGSIGTIIGDANIYKTGEGNFTLAGESFQYTGNFYVAGGSVMLAGSSDSSVSVDSSSGALAAYYGDAGIPNFGRTLWNAGSINIAGTVDSQNESSKSSLSEASRNGALIRSLYKGSKYDTDSDGNQSDQWDYYQEAYFASPAAGTLVVNENQAIRNFQSMFANGAAATDSNKSAASAVQNAADTVDKDAPIIAGTGAGSYLAVAKGSTLAIYQEAGQGGIYKGTICGVNDTSDGAGISSTGELVEGGTIVKYGKGDLALVLEGANFEKLVALEGGLVVNINAINHLDAGSYDWTTGKWTRDSALYVGETVSLKIVENGASTLNLRLNANNIGSDSVTFSTYALIDTVGGEVDVSSDDRRAGYIEVASEQRFVEGVVTVENGMTLILTATDFAGEAVDTDDDGVADTYRYYDKNGSGTYTDSAGNKYEISRVEKIIATGEYRYFYTDGDNVEQEVSEDDVGNVVWTDKISFSGGTFANAAAIVLKGKDETATSDSATVDASRYSTLSFNGTCQKIQNLTGDEYSKVELGTGTLTVDINKTELDGATVSTFAGGMSGVGNLVKTGSETFTLGGGATLSYMGATVISEGDIVATKSKSLWQSSAIILNNKTSATFAGAQNFVTLFGGSDSAVELENGALILGADASRANIIKTALQPDSSGVCGIIITDDLGNSDEVVKTFNSYNYSDVDALVSAYLHPLLELADDDQSAALTAYFSGNASDASAVLSAFNLTSEAAQLTKADVTRIYLTLLKQNGLLADDTATADMIDRLAFNGSLTANSISKQGSDRATLSGTVSAKSLTIYEGAVEVAAGAFTFDSGISVRTGATFAVNVAAKADIVLDKVITGEGNFEKLGDGALTLGENVAYLGTTTVKAGNLTMTLRSNSGSTYSQGNITVENANSVLTFAQASDTVWTGTLVNEGNLVKTGAGTLELRGSGNTLKGAVKVREGTLLLADVAFVGGDFVVYDDATLIFEQNSAANTIAVPLVGTGTIIKTGSANLTFGQNGDFSGTLIAREGSLILAGEILNSATAVVESGATLELGASQTVRTISGSGTLLFGADNVSLTVKLKNDSAIYYASSSGKYVSYGTDYSEFESFAGTLSSSNSGSEFGLAGTGSFVFAGTFSNDDITLSVAEKATLVSENLSCQISVKDASASVVLAYDGADDATYSGKILHDNLAYSLGKIGAGTLIMNDADDAWRGANVVVYEGTLRLNGAQAFAFDSAVVADGATLALECKVNSDGTNNVDLGSIEGSGTIKLILGSDAASPVLELSSESMLPVSGEKYFNGLLDAASFDVVVKESMTLCAIATTGNFSTDDVAVTFNQNTDSAIGGEVSANMTVTGSGTLTLESSKVSGTILVNNGNLQINATADTLNNSADGGLRVENAATIYVANSSATKVGGMLSCVELRGAENSVGNVRIIKTGDDEKTLNFGSAEDGGKSILNVEENLWNKFVSDNDRASLTLGVNEGTLMLSGVANLHSAVRLTTLSAGTLEIYADPLSPETLDRTVSGDGNVAFSGGGKTTVSANQTYTGATTLETGSQVIFDNVSLATSTFTVESGAQMTGGIRLVGATVSSSARTSVAAASSSTATTGGNFVNKGTVFLNVANGDCIEYAGTFANNGEIIITGSGATSRGTELVLFKSLSGTDMDENEMIANFGNGRLTNNSSALMLAQANGTISAYSLGTSFAETSGLRDGLAGSFTAVLDNLGGLNGTTSGIVLESQLLEEFGSAIGVALNKASAASLADDVANLSPIGFASMIAMTRNAFANDRRAIAERASHRRFDSANDLYDNGAEFFARVQSTLFDGSTDSSAANFDYKTYGVLVGMDVKPDDYSLYGFAVGGDYGSATLHHGGGKIRSESYRATAFMSSLLGDGSVFSDLGVQVAMNNFETDRRTIVGKSEGDTEAWSFGAFATFGKGISLFKEKYSRLIATPYVGVSYQYSRVNSFKEDGAAGLSTDSFDANSVVGRLGVSLDWQFPLGEWEGRFSLDFAYAHEFADGDTDIDASFRQVAGTQFRVSGTIASEDTFSFSPSLTIDLSEHNAIQLGYVLEYGTDEELSHNFNAGFRHTF